MSQVQQDQQTLVDVYASVAKKGYDLLGNWATKGAAIIAIMYVFGYMTLHRHISILGLPTEIQFSAADYLNAGIEFVIYAVSNGMAIFSLLACVSIVLLPIVFIRRARKGPAKPDGTDSESGGVDGQISHGSVSLLVALFVMAVFTGVWHLKAEFANSVLIDSGVDRSNLAYWIMTFDDTGTGLVFLYLAAITALGAFVAWHQGSAKVSVGWNKACAYILMGVLVFQCLQLPAFFGTYVYHKSFPRLGQLSSQKLGKKSAVWLIWESADSYTLYVVPCPKDSSHRAVRPSILTVAKTSLSPLQVVAHDDLIDLMEYATQPVSVDQGCACTASTESLAPPKTIEGPDDVTKKGNQDQKKKIKKTGTDAIQKTGTNKDSKIKKSKSKKSDGHIKK